MNAPVDSGEIARKLSRGEAQLALARANIELSHSVPWRAYLERLKDLRTEHLEGMLGRDDVHFEKERAFILVLDEMLEIEKATESQVQRLEQQVEGLRKQLRSLQNAGLAPTN